MRCLAAALLFVAAAPVRANEVVEWNRIASRIAASEQALAMVNIAMFEVLNFIEGRYESAYLVRPAEPLRISQPAAVASAAHFTLAELYPEHKALLDGLLASSLARIPEQADKRGGEIQGRSLAMNLYALRGLILDGEVAIPRGRAQGLLETARLHALLSTTALRIHAENAILPVVDLSGQ